MRLLVIDRQYDAIVDYLKYKTFYFCRFMLQEYHKNNERYHGVIKTKE